MNGINEIILLIMSVLGIFAFAIGAIASFRFNKKQLGFIILFGGICNIIQVILSGTIIIWESTLNPKTAILLKQGSTAFSWLIIFTLMYLFISGNLRIKKENKD